MTSRPVIGLSGGIGAGKSAVAGLLRDLGADICDADREVHELYADPEIQKRLQSRFGEGILSPDGSISRQALARIVFRDPDARKFLEDCLHPRVRAEIESRVASSKAPWVILDVPLLETSPLISLCTHKIFVEAPDEVRWNRVQERGWSREDWQRREAAQATLDEKRRGADLILDNTGDLEVTRETLTPWLESLETP